MTLVCISNVALTEFANLLIRCLWSKRGIKNDSVILDLCSWFLLPFIEVEKTESLGQKVCHQELSLTCVEFEIPVIRVEMLMRLVEYMSERRGPNRRCKFGTDQHIDGI